MHAFRGEVLARRLHVLGRDADARAPLHGTAPVVIAPRGDHEPAAADAEIERLVKALAAVLEQDVLAGDAEVGGAVLDVGRHVGRAHDDERHVGPPRGEDQLARRVSGSSMGATPACASSGS